ncbi:putative reverse transcriptase zinc-binding domain-containing protein [Helianthus annuus]|nr:putative reverse transcriptase zinc-binding domain-containing protein [Helianthus annuus]
MSSLIGVNPSTEKDRWIWAPDVSGKYSTIPFKKLAMEILNTEDNYTVRRSGWVPSKCNIFIWRADLDCIPTRQALMRVNIFVDSNACALCGEAQESVDHIFTAGEISVRVWNRLSDRGKLQLLFSPFLSGI